MLGTSRAPWIFSFAAAACAGLRLSPSPARVPAPAAPRKNWRRVVVSGFMFLPSPGT